MQDVGGKRRSFIAGVDMEGDTGGRLVVKAYLGFAKSSYTISSELLSHYVSLYYHKIPAISVLINVHLNECYESGEEGLCQHKLLSMYIQVKTP